MKTRYLILFQAMLVFGVVASCADAADPDSAARATKIVKA